MNESEPERRAPEPPEEPDREEEPGPHIAEPERPAPEPPEEPDREEEPGPHRRAIRARAA